MAKAEHSYIYGGIGTMAYMTFAKGISTAKKGTKAPAPLTSTATQPTSSTSTTTQAPTSLTSALIQAPTSTNFYNDTGTKLIDVYH